MPPRPILNLTEPLDDESFAQRIAQRDFPQPDHRMRPSSGGGDGKLRALSGHRLAQSHDQVSGQEGAVPRRAEDPFRVGPVGRGPVESREDSGERSWMMPYPIDNDGQAKGRKAQGIAVGAEEQAFALRLEPRNDPGQNRVAAKLAQRLIAAAHSLRAATRKHHPRYAKSLNHCGRFLEFGEPARKGRRVAEWSAVPATKREKGTVDGEPTIRTCRAMAVIKLDLSGLKCPLPALKTRKALKSLSPGDRLEVRCTDPLAVIDIPHLVGVSGDRWEIIERGERDTVFRIEKAAPTLEPEPPAC
jgi:tRNA 2-thiouridine synthesizing protein A